MSIPLTIIGGFLGSGKTTLINRLLADPQDIRFAVIVNDFGAINIDEQLIASHDGQTIALANGCVCCTIGDSFLRTLLQVVGSRPAPDHIVIEASGVADPARIAEIALVDKDLSLDAVIVLADASQLLRQHSDRRLADTIERQINSADLVLLNKSDLATPNEIEECRAFLRERRPSIPVQQVVRAGVPHSVLFGMTSDRGPQRAGDNEHELPFDSHSVTADGVVSKKAISDLLRAAAPRILRAKGILQVATGQWSTLQMVGERIEWLPGARPENGLSQLVVIGPKPLPEHLTADNVLLCRYPQA